MAESEEKKQPLAAWNEAESFGAALRAFMPLCGQVLFRPVDFFTQLFSCTHPDIRRRLTKAVVFALILSYIKLFLDLANLYWFKYFSKNIFPAVESLQFSFLADSVFASPFFLLRPLLILGLTAALVAVGVKLILGFDKALGSVLFIICYRCAADIFYVLPFIGGIFAIAWSVTLLVAGIRQAYKPGFLRSFVAGVVVPVAMLFFILVGMGPALNRAVLVFYPEMKAQLVRINEVTAYATMSSIAAGIETYKTDLGFYPAHLGVLRKYVSDSMVDDATSTSYQGGYVYEYGLVDDGRYRLYARPKEAGVTGRFVFYADASGLVRFDGPDGQAIKDLSQIEGRILGR
ncbi:MAG TPA: hypothetical protein DCL35_08390 [Candidatus Omnitrophica bacterium]|nr:hypothetical protein [Candidatus Omnitrophota bacterium]